MRTIATIRWLGYSLGLWAIVGTVESRGAQPSRPPNVVLLGADAAIDGVNLVPLLRPSGELAERSLFWHYPHYKHYQLEGATPYGAIRRSDWRLVEFYDDHRLEFYNLRDNASERHDVAGSEPDKANALRDELHGWLQAVGAQMPTGNSAYDPNKPEHAAAGAPAPNAAVKTGQK